MSLASPMTFELAAARLPQRCGSRILSVVITLIAVLAVSDAYSLDQTTKLIAAPEQVSHEAETARWSGIGAVEQKPRDDLDRKMMKQAERACQSQRAEGYLSLFQAFTLSPEVRRHYSAAAIRVITQDVRGNVVESLTVPSSDYQFPILMKDGRLRFLGAVDAGEHVQIIFNQSNTNWISVEWRRVRGIGTDSKGGRLVATASLHGSYGSPSETEAHADGQLLFAPTANCWELVVDKRIALSAAGR